MRRLRRYRLLLSRRCIRSPFLPPNLHEGEVVCRDRVKLRGPRKPLAACLAALGNGSGSL
jgi:hypothetical protein